MAKATIVEEQSDRPIASVTLELTGEEAAVLMQVVGRIGGSQSGPKAMMETIYLALDSAGLSTTRAGRIRAILPGYLGDIRDAQ